MTSHAAVAALETNAASSDLAFRIEPLAPDYLERLRAAGVDEFGNQLRDIIVDAAGSPLRCCLREAKPGEHITLIAHQPHGGHGPYAESGPVFIHRERCDGYEDADRYPAGLRHRQQVFRSYDTDGRIHDARVVEGADAEPSIADMLSQPDVVLLHSRNVVYGCYMFAIYRE